MLPCGCAGLKFRNAPPNPPRPPRPPPPPPNPPPPPHHPAQRSHNRIRRIAASPQHPIRTRPCHRIFHSLPNLILAKIRQPVRLARLSIHRHRIRRRIAHPRHRRHRRARIPSARRSIQRILPRTQTKPLHPARHSQPRTSAATGVSLLRLFRRHAARQLQPKVRSPRHNRDPLLRSLAPPPRSTPPPA